MENNHKRWSSNLHGHSYTTKANHLKSFKYSNSNLLDRKEKALNKDIYRRTLDA